MKPVNRLYVEPSVEDLLPNTKLDHLLSEQDQQLFEYQLLPSPPQTLFEAIKQLAEFVSGTSPDRLYSEYYPMFYRMARTQLDAGLSNDQIDDLLSPLASRDQEFVNVVRQAIEDALAGRPPRYES